MYAPDKKTFLEKAKRGNLIPVWCELLADQDTPVSAYERLMRDAGGNPRRHGFLLESVEGGEHIARFSFLGGHPRAIFRATGHKIEIEGEDGTTQSFSGADPLSKLREYMAQYRVVPDPALPRFFGGAVGYIGYDAVTQFERAPLSKGSGLDWPDMIFMITDTILVFDRARHTLKVVANAHVQGDPGRAYEEAVARIEAIRERLSQPAAFHFIDVHEPVADVPVTSNMSQSEFCSRVEQTKEYIRAGDIIQAVLSHRFEVGQTGNSLDVYRALRSINPSPYMYCLDFDNRHVVGSSPEVHVRCEDGRAEVRPIAGTRWRSADPDEDRRLSEELLADPKERAEHIMLVDLARNDLGRVCTYGSVRVPELMTIERYSHVMHIVSDVVGDLAPGQDVYDVLKATFPAGTVSGAPKVRAMEIIAELEPTRRGPYAGAVGYFSFTGNLDSCITIRTALLDGRKAYVQAGAGIVADSNPEREYEETRNKARGLLKALAMAGLYAKARKDGAQ